MGILLAALILGGGLTGAGKAFAAWSSVGPSGVSNLTYDGTPKVIGIADGTAPVTGSDATIKFSDAANGTFKPADEVADLLTNAGTVFYKIEAVDDGAYDGSDAKTGSFAIAKLNLSTATLTAVSSQTFTNSAKTPTPDFIADGSKWTAIDGQYDVTYANNTNAGLSTATAAPTVIYTAKSVSVNYTGAVSQKFTIAKGVLASYVDLSQALKDWLVSEHIVNVNASNALQAHNAPAASGALVGLNGGGSAPATGFGTASYAYKNSAGKAVAAAEVKDADTYSLEVTVTEGSNILGGTLTGSFEVTYKELNDNPLLTAIPVSVDFSNTKSYTVDWPDVVAPAVYGALDSIYNVSVKQGGNYLAAKYVTNNKSAKSVTFILDGSPVTNSVGTVTLEFEAKGKSNDNPKQVWQFGDVEHSHPISMNVTIARKPMSDNMILLTDYPIVYTGADITDGELAKKFIVVSDGQLSLATHYTIDPVNPALNRKNAGVNAGWIEITGIGNFTGTARKTFTIERAPITVDVAVTGTKVYNGKADIDTATTGGKPRAAAVFAFAPVSDPTFANTVDYEIRGARYSDSTAGAICSLTARVVLKNSDKSRNFRFAGSSPDSVTVKAYGLTIAKLNIDSSNLNYAIPNNHYKNGTQRGIGAVTLKSPLALGNGGTLTTLYNYPKNTVKPDYDTTVASISDEAGKDTTFIPKSKGVYKVKLKVKGSSNLRDTTVELGDYEIKEPAGPVVASPSADQALTIRQGRSANLKVSATSPNEGTLTFKWYTVEGSGDNIVRTPLNITGLNTVDSVLSFTVSGSVASSTGYCALVTNTAPSGVQDPRAVAVWSPVFTVTVDDPPISMVGAKIAVNGERVWTYTGFPITPSGTDVTVSLPSYVDGADTTWTPIDASEYALTYVSNTNVGTATIRATAIPTGKYQGSVSTTFAIAKKQFATTDIAYTDERIYTGDTLGARVKENPPMTGMGEITVRYGTSTDVPVDAGDYDVYVNVAGGPNVSSSNGFQYLGTYVIKPVTPVAGASGNLSYTNPASLNHFEGDTAATYGIGEVTFKNVKGYTGTIDVYYNGDEEAPKTAGQYTVTVDISGDDNVEAATLTLGIYTIKSKGDAVAQGNREIPAAPVVATVSVAPVKAPSSGFTAGPSPVSKSGAIKFFSAKAVKSGSLYIFDARGDAVAKVSAKPGSGEIGSWNLKDKKGAAVAEGTYVIKGALIGKDGAREKVSFAFSVVK